MALLRTQGHSAFLEWQLDPSSIDDSVCDAFLAQFPTLNLLPHELYAYDPNVVRTELMRACVARGILSRRQLYERMVEFWTDHFNVTARDVGHLKPIDDRNVIRAHALGNFSDLLHASAQSPAMIAYLDNNTNVAGRPNENYARELLELHTVGVNGGYSQSDVSEVAKCFTGWTYYNRPSDGVLQGTFRFMEARHETGVKTVMGQALASGGMQDGLDVLDLLASHPNTAKYVGKKLIRWLLDEEPSTGLVNAVAATWTATQGDIKAVVRAILSPENIANAPFKLKRPFHVMVATVRALRANVQSVNSVPAWLGAAGNQPYAWPAPDGYPDDSDHWKDLLLPRWNFPAAVVAGSVAGLSVALSTTMRDPRQLVSRINAELLHGTMDAQTSAILSQFARGGRLTAQRCLDAYGLALASPQFQWF